MEKSEWFEEWFDTPFYHILYQNRDEEEAANFVAKLIRAVGLKKGAKVLDLACGKGRHSIQLNKAGFEVVGADLSVNSIAQAKTYEKDTLNFVVHDMREPLKDEKFDAIFNLFTSFGYFGDKKDNLKVLSACYEMLNENGLLVIDFMNSLKVAKTLVKKEKKIIEDIHFDISRSADTDYIYKSITFGHVGKQHCYTERVQALQQKDFENLLKKTKFTVKGFYGDYDLTTFDPEKSNRLIIVATKNGYDHLD